jgi:hypothetical protein
MLGYRVFPHLPTAESGRPGHPLFIDVQGAGRLDNPPHYEVWYFALESSGAVAEAFGDLDEWGPEMFDYPLLPGSRRALATFRLGDDIPLLDLDDSRNLLRVGLRPTQVIERNKGATQRWALDIFNMRNDRGEPEWHGVKWWSYHRPQWRIVGYWGDQSPEPLNVEELTMTCPPVVDAMASLRRSCKLTSPPDCQ